MYKQRIAIGLVFNLLLPTVVMAQISTTPELVVKLKELGYTSISREVIAGTLKLYAPFHETTPKDGVKVAKDEKYGTDERHKLDVYEPTKKADKLLPILVFIHGGGFVAGDKSTTGTPFYDNVGYYLARHGVLTIVPNYRLAPKYKWPSGTEDVAAALTWVQKNGGRFGGDTNNVFIMGHSAGGAHVASYVFQEEFQLKEGDGIKGAILVSGIYDPSKMSLPAYYGDDPSKYPAMASVKYVEGRKIPVFIVFAEHDPPSLQAQTLELFQALCQRDKTCPAIKQLIGHTHLSEVYHINTKDESIGPDILEFMQEKGKKGK